VIEAQIADTRAAESVPGVASVAARLNRLPMGRVHYVIVGVVGIATFFDIFDINVSGVLGAVLTREFQLDRVRLPLVLASAFLGMFLGAVFLGRIADDYGRRRALLLNLAIYSFFTLLGAFSVNAEMLIVTRFLAGIGIGSTLPVIDTYLAELLPARDRGRGTAWAYFMGFLSVPAVGVLARVLVPTKLMGLAGWRWVFVVGSFGGLLVWMAQHFLPESPRWLESVGRYAEAEAIVTQFEREAERSGPLPQPDVAEKPMFKRPTFKVLFSSELRRRTIVLWIFQVFQTMGYNGFAVMIPLVLGHKGFSIEESLAYTAMTFVGYPAGSVIAVGVAERLDRRWLIVLSAGGLALCGMGLGFATDPWYIVAFGFVFTVLSTVFVTAFHIFMAELFPTFVRATAAGTAYGLSRLSSAAVPFFMLPLLQQYGPVWMFTSVAVAMIIVMLDIGLLAPSTTGKALERVH
jgi:putative MFS transporter